MPDTNQGLEKENNAAQKKRSFFGGSLDINSKDFLDFRYNTKEEIDKFNDEMTITSDLDDIIKKTSENNEFQDNKKLDETINYKDNISNTSKDFLQYNTPINNDPEDKNNNSGPINEVNDEKTKETTEISHDKQGDEIDNIENYDINFDNNKIYDPFELSIDEIEEDEDNEDFSEDEIFDPFELYEDDEDIVDEQPVKQEAVVDEQPVEQEAVVDEQPVEQEAVVDEQPVEQEAVVDEQPVEQEAVIDEQPVEQRTIKDKEFYINTGTQEKEKITKKKGSNTKKTNNEEIDLQQPQDSTEEYIPTDEEIFEQEPTFFADDEISQQFLQLVQNTRKIFKLESKNKKDDLKEQDNFFIILGGKTKNTKLEYLFYLIEEPNEPIDLFIKKVETSNNNEETEHMVQFSYDKNKTLNIFVDEVILYQEINKLDLSTPGYSDTKAILEKFIFLTENYYRELETKLENENKEKQKKRQLQQIFKGF